MYVFVCAQAYSLTSSLWHVHRHSNHTVFLMWLHHHTTTTPFETHSVTNFYFHLNYHWNVFLFFFPVTPGEPNRWARALCCYWLEEQRNLSWMTWMIQNRLWDMLSQTHSRCFTWKGGLFFFLLSIHSWSSERQRRSDAKRLTVMAWPQTKPSNALRCHCVPQPAKRTA